MKIAIDISPLQTPHRMRGIGYVVINFINNISSEDRQKHDYVFYIYPKVDGKDFQDPLKLLNVEGMNYEIRYINPDHGVSVVTDDKKLSIYRRFRLRITRSRQYVQRQLPSKTQRFLTNTSDQIKHLFDYYFGTDDINVENVDVVVQTDQLRSFPKSHSAKKALIAYDIIPYIIEWEYLWSYQTARVHGLSRKSSFKRQVSRYLYIEKVRQNSKHADVILAISDTTKQDFQHFMGINPNKITVTHLGVSMPELLSSEVKLKRYEKISWGSHVPKEFKLEPDAPFILYVGGADRRRRIEDLVTAFNNLRAEGVELKLVLSGDSMQGPDNIPTKEIREALLNSSYFNDIVFMGFTDDSTRDWLYKNALAFVYPSKYEGFGLPVLEAMIHSCPVVCYENQAVKEVAGSLPYYAHDAEGLRKSILQLIELPKTEFEALKERSKAHAQKFSWTKTSSQMIDVLEKFI